MLLSILLTCWYFCVLLSVPLPIPSSRFPTFPDKQCKTSTLVQLPQICIVGLALNQLPFQRYQYLSSFLSITTTPSLPPPHTHMIPIKYLTHCIWEGSGKIALSWLRSLNPTQSCLNISVKQTSTWGKSFYSSKRFNLQIMTGPFWTSVHKQKRPFLENVQFLSFQLSNPLLYFISFFDYHQRIYEIPNTY